MENLLPLHIHGSCIASDEELFRNVDATLRRGLRDADISRKERPGHIAIVGSGPSVKDDIEELRQLKRDGMPLVAVKDAHDWLIDNGIVPDYAFAVDPQAHRWNCFSKKQRPVIYMISGQCNPTMFDHLADQDVRVWWPYIKKDYFYPPQKSLIGGATTSGLRAVSLFYWQGWRHFDLYGFDSCLADGVLRVNGTGPKEKDEIIPIRLGLGPEFKTYYCNLSMALQAQNFQTYYDWLPDAHFYPHGQGLIPDIIRRNTVEWAKLKQVETVPDNGRISFIHKWTEREASYRYRAQIPARLMDVPLNDLTASTLIFAKPLGEEILEMAYARKRGQRVIVDFCDDHFDWLHYQEALRWASYITCPTKALAGKISSLGYLATVIPDPYEFPEAKPHCQGVRLLWFGHSNNRASLDRILSSLKPYPLRTVANWAGTIPWSYDRMLQEFRHADIMVLPATDTYKSANRAVEAIRQGCFVVAEPHPSLEDIPGIWVGDIVEGIEWAKRNSEEARKRTSWAQNYVKATFSPRIVADAWRTLIQSLITLDVEKRDGLDGKISMSLRDLATSNAMSDTWTLSEATLQTP